MDYLEIKALCHHGIKGQKWGYRRYQNEDGSLTEAGIKRYGKLNEKGGFDAKGKRKFKVDQRAIKGQRMYELGKSGFDIRRSKRITNTVLVAVGFLSVNAAFKGTSPSRRISKGEFYARSALLGIGAASVGGIIANTIVKDKQMDNMRAFYTNGSKQYIRINNKK